MITQSQTQDLRDAFELFIGDQNKRTFKPSEMLAVFLRLGIEKDNASGVELLQYMVDELSDPELTFDRFIRQANDFYNQRESS